MWRPGPTLPRATRIDNLVSKQSSDQGKRGTSCQCELVERWQSLALCDQHAPKVEHTFAPRVSDQVRYTNVTRSELGNENEFRYSDLRLYRIRYA
jgi:hypothetical protein